MVRRLLALAACLGALSMASVAQATTFGFGFAIDFQNGDGAIGSGHLYADDNGDGSYTVTGADGDTSFVTFSTLDFYAPDTIVDFGPGWFGTQPDVTIFDNGDGSYSFDSLMLIGNDHFFDFDHFDGDLIGIAGEVGGPAQFQFGPEDAGEAPEIATWASMCLGFGAIGAAMRRRTVARLA